MEKFSMQQWVFDEAYGRYDIDLGDSNAPCLTSHQLGSFPDVELNYGKNIGTDSLRRLVANLYGASTHNIGVTHGAQEALYLIYNDLLDKGDHVITWTPGWEQAWKVPESIGCEVTTLGLNKDMCFDLSDLAQSITPKTKLIILNSPCNPSGTTLSQHDKATLLDLVKQYALTLVVDEEYLSDLTDSMFHLSPNVISVSSISKIYGAPGLRIGWICCEKKRLNGIMRLKHYTTITNSILCETLASKILERQSEFVSSYKNMRNAGLQVLRKWISENNDVVRWIEPQDTPFAWLLLDKQYNSLEIARRMLYEHKILVMPAEVFGLKHGLRITFCRDLEQLNTGLKCLKSSLVQTLMYV
ncbi:pyridoxal phosphate-dependent aminotransferase [Pantoea sp. Mb-10]|uniref:pyridoxal phosphate-dependent aminotransferase n=1 Tax=unclassified Pantoea TaxID=2630326 RepID=UPI001E53A400|nr:MULTISPECIES: pyridoxal phosphate-dependent aminotransferase [unclassified Pantoea]MCE0490293.1 pyridoxal phosphate-dependent aminotransferase [Pantoea sp. Mb-10]MCE0501424.1 pyridoxal phosphate-dependent aminotransferase [Pantoea sp. Pb-8]